MSSSFTSFFSRSSASPPDLPDPLDAPPAPAAASARVTASASLPSLADRTRTDVPALVPSGGPSRRDGLQDPQSSDSGRGREPSWGTSQSGSPHASLAFDQRLQFSSSAMPSLALPRSSSSSATQTQTPDQVNSATVDHILAQMDARLAAQKIDHDGQMQQQRTELQQQRTEFQQHQTELQQHRTELDQTRAELVEHKATTAATFEKLAVLSSFCEHRNYVSTLLQDAAARQLPRGGDPWFLLTRKLTQAEQDAELDWQTRVEAHRDAEVAAKKVRDATISRGKARVRCAKGTQPTPV